MASKAKAVMGSASTKPVNKTLDLNGVIPSAVAQIAPKATPLEIAGKYTLGTGLQDAYATLTAAQNAYNNLGTDTTYSDMAKAYEERARASLAQQEAALLNQLNASKGATARNYESSAAQNYINYMKQRGALPEQLASLGINGGASETALTRVMNNYALGQGANSASRNAAISSLQGAYDTNVANLRRATEDNIAANALEMQQKQAQFDYQRQVDAYNRLQDAYARASTLEQQQYERGQAKQENLINRFDKDALKYAATKKGLEQINKAIKDYKKNHKGDKYYKDKLAALNARKGAIKEVLRKQ